MAQTEYKFEGWMGLDPSSSEGKMVWQEFTPKEWEEMDVDIKVTHCGICGSDIHTLRSGWGPTMYPCCVGHEIVGVAVRVGSKAEGDIKVGDRVGVGAQSDACLGRLGDCEECASGLEQYCSRKTVTTFDDTHFNGGMAYGGYALYSRSPSHFVFKIPDAIPSAEAAPLLCSGVTMYAPLKRNGCGPGKSVGIIGIGGLGHAGLLFAKALGADRVVAISRGANKKADALKMGADGFIATGEDEDWVEKNARSLDIIVSTVSSPGIPIVGYLKLVRTNGAFVQVGIPDDGVLPVPLAEYIYMKVKIETSFVGSPAEIREMLQLAADKGIRLWVEERPMSEANKAIVDMEEGRAKYRYVLVN